MSQLLKRRVGRRVGVFVLLLLAIEFFDEIAYGYEQAALPLIRDSLSLSYAQIGLLFTIPMLVGMVAESLMGLVADGKHRRTLILGGGIGFIVSLFLVSISTEFYMLLFAFCLFNPSSGAFVGLSQAALMDVDPTRHEQNMARWTFIGAIGVFAGPLLLGVVMAATGNWRHGYYVLMVIGLVLWIAASRARFAKAVEVEPPESMAAGLREALRALRNWNVTRWLVLLVFSDFMLDVLGGFTALYFVDVVGTSEADAGIALAVWSGVGLVGDLLVIPLLERVRGLTYLRVSAGINLLLYPAFLLVPGYLPKLILIAALGFTNAGWYSVLAGRLYTSMPGRSGLVLTVSNVTTVFSALIPLALGATADTFGLLTALWLLILGPIVLIIALPRDGSAVEPVSEVDEAAVT